MIFVDSSVWIDWLRGTPTLQTEVLGTKLLSDAVLVGDLVLVEVLQGIRHPRQAERIRRQLFETIIIQVVSPTVAVAAAANYRRLRAMGITPRSTIDTIIATRCIVEDWPLLANDRDFDPFFLHLGLRSASI